MQFRSHYEVLGVPSSASQDEIKKAYRRLAMKWHPDRNLGAAEDAETVFKGIQLAYEILSDVNRRRYYDDTLSSAGRADRSATHSNWSPAPIAGQNAYARCSIGVDLALAGCTLTVPHETMELCSECIGEGAVSPGYSCKNCGATGRKSYSDGSSYCRKCNGNGRMSRSKCATCRGKGFVMKKHSLKVSLPKGVYDGCCFTIQGKGGKGLYGGPDGALILTVSVKPIGKIQLHGPDVIIPLRVDFLTAVLGGTVHARTRLGDFHVAIPELSRAGTKVYIEGAGLRKTNSTMRGRLTFEVILDLPRRLTRITDEVRAKLEALV